MYCTCTYKIAKTIFFYIQVIKTKSVLPVVRKIKSVRGQNERSYKNM